MSRVTAIISALVITKCIVCLSWAVNHYRDSAIAYKAQHDKNARELKLANAASTDMQMRQRDVAALDAKYTKELAGAKLKMILQLMMLALVVVGCTSKQSYQSRCVKPAASGVDNAASPTADAAERGLFHPRSDHMQNNWKEPRSILMSSADRVAHIDGAPLCV